MLDDVAAMTQLAGKKLRHLRCFFRWLLDLGSNPKWPKFDSMNSARTIQI